MSEMKFENSRKRLSEAFKTLEKTIDEKFHEVKINSKMLAASADEDSLMAKTLISQEAAIKNLEAELSKLNSDLEEAGREIEFLNEKNQMLLDKLNKFKSEGKEVAELIEADLKKIEQIINNE